MTVDEINTLLQQACDGLSPQLLRGARYILAHPEDVALTSMRRLAAHAGVKPSTMVRLARSLGFDGFDDLREPFCDWLRGGEGAYEARARALRSRRQGDGVAALMDEMAAVDAECLRMACGGGRQQQEETMRAAASLWAARQVFVLGLRSCFSMAHYFAYTCSMLRNGCRLVDGVGGTYLDGLREVGEGDCLLVFSFRPYARDTVNLIEQALAAGAQVIAVTDSLTAPVATRALHVLIAETTSPNFFQSLVAPQALAQQLLAALVCVAGDDGVAAIKKSEARLRDVGAYWQEPKRKRRP